MLDEAGGKQHNITEAAPNERKLGDESWSSARRRPASFVSKSGDNIFPVENGGSS